MVLERPQLALILAVMEDLEQREERRLSQVTRSVVQPDQPVQTQLALAIRRLAVETADPLALRLTPEVLDRSELPIELEGPQPRQIVAADPLGPRIEHEATQPLLIESEVRLVAQIDHGETQPLLIENEDRLVAQTEREETRLLLIENEARLVAQIDHGATQPLLIENEDRLVAQTDHGATQPLLIENEDRLVAQTALAVTQLLHPTRVVEAIRTTDERATETRL